MPGATAATRTSTSSKAAAHARVYAMSHARVRLSAHGRTLRWTRIAGVPSYVLSTKRHGARVSYRRVHGTRIAPRPIPGRTVTYRVRPNVPRSHWTNAVSIRYRRALARRPVPPPTAKRVDGGAAGPRAEPLKVGVNAIGNFNYAPYSDAALFRNAGVTYTREDVGDGSGTGSCTGTDYVCIALQNGIAPMVLFEGYADSNMTSEIVSLAHRLDTLATTYPTLNKMHVIEFGNEVWWGTSGPKEDAVTYGAQYNAAHQALAAAGLGSWKLLAIGNGLGTCVNSYTSPDWINKVIAAQSSGAAGIDGWTVHPYGPMTTDAGCGAAGQGYGWPEVQDYHTIATNAGSNAPWYVTEVGQCLGGTGCNVAVPQGSTTDTPQGAGTAPYYTQAADVRQYLTDAGGDTRTATPAKYPWLAAIMFYTAYDDGSGWFGLLSNDQAHLSQTLNQQRPAFTVLRDWISANGQG